MKTIIRFTASWCGPCRAFAPIFDKVAASYKDNDLIEFQVIDIDIDPETATKFGVRSIPTVVVVDGDAALETQVGSMSESQLKSVVERNL